MSKAKPLFSDKETEDEFIEWRKSHANEIDAFEKLPDKTKSLLWQLAEFWCERVNAKWDEALDLVKIQREIIESNQSTAEMARKSGELSALLANFDKIRSAETQRKNLALGRPKGTKARQEAAKKNQADLEKAINDLFSDSNKPGFQWTNDEITTFILKRFGAYKSSTVKQKVKIIAAKHRKNRIRPENY